MRRAVAIGFLVVMAAAPASAQTKSPGQGPAYASYVERMLTCLAEAPDPMCVVAARDLCLARSGVYDACLEALATALGDVRARLAAQVAPDTPLAPVPACSVLGPQADCDLDFYMDDITRLLSATDTGAAPLRALIQGD